MVALTGHTDPVNQVAFSPDGSLLASAGDDGCVWLWDVAQRMALARLSWGAKWAFGLAFSPDGRTLAVGTETSMLLLREMDGTWNPFHQSRDHQNWVTALSFSADGELLASGSADGNVCLWDAAHRRKHALKAISAGVAAVRSVAFAPTGLAVAAGGATGLGVWAATNQEPIAFHRLPDSDVRSVGFTPDGEMVVAAAGRSLLYLNLSNQKVIAAHQGGPGSFRCLAVAPFGFRILTGRDDGTVQLWHESKGLQKTFTCHVGAVNALAFSPNGRTVASAGDDFCVSIWDVE